MSARRRGSLPLAEALDAHRSALAGCRRCTPAAGVAPIVGAARAPRAMLIGQAPGRTELAGGRPFMGRAGRTLFGWLGRAGIDERQFRDAVYIAAITRCYPGAHPSGRGDRVPSRRERECCAGWLTAELRLIRPRLIIPVGRLAIDRFFGPVSLDGVVGAPRTIEHEGGASVAIALPHPSGASSWIHQPGHGALLDQALEHLGRALTRLDIIPHRRSAA